MKLVARVLTLFLLSLLSVPAWADDTGNFVVRLGQDTTGVEHYTRGADKLEVDQLGRAPRTLRRHFTYDMKGGVLTHVNVVVQPPGSTTPTQTVDATIEGDSAHVVIKNGATPPTDQHLPLPRGTLVIFGSSPWAQYEGQIMKLAKSKSDTLGGVLLFVGARNTDRFLLKKLGRDTVEITNTHGDIYRAAVDKAGHILGTTPIAGTQKFAITRVVKLDMDATATSYMAREQAGQGLGVLSPRDTVRVANAGGATLMIDYGRPAKRGRVVMGGLVPSGEVWRTGANAATQFRTDKALDFGGTVVPAGFYTLWSLYTGTGWKLIVNSETGQWGTEHKADKDLFTIDMKVSTLPQVVERFTISVDGNDKGGVLNLDWDTTRASLPFTTQPSP
jgi:hypothetical protein